MVKINRKLILTALLAMSFFSCNKKENTDIRTYEYFSAHLKSTMGYDTIVSNFGIPDNDKGSGIHIYVYNLTDGTFIWIGFATTILYARHLDQNQQLLHTLF